MDKESFVFALIVVGVLSLCTFGMYSDCKAQQTAQVEQQRQINECVSSGHEWTVVGQHYNPPYYVKSGSILIPIGGEYVDDWGCR